ncbi:MAG TPA: PilZ domain-containing protein [Kofleriaceae bacterium]|nr:PilZ domain-containing protein [Kofleriaceae bacterium]
MAIATWLSQALWRAHDWRAAIDRLAAELRAGAPAPRPALELAAASEYVEPDRRRAVALYELAGRDGVARARELAIELGWWPAAARLAAVAGDALAEAEAWWDAGNRELCALALSGVRAAEGGDRARELESLLAGRDLSGTTAARGKAESGDAAADALVMAARFARAAGRTVEANRHLEAALGARSSHAIAASHLLANAVNDREPELVRKFLRLRLDDLEPLAWIDATRACAIALTASEHHRGFGLRLLRHALDRAYELAIRDIPGHLAMWTVLASHAAADGTRRELLPLAVTALDATPNPEDRVWISALATEISLRDAHNTQVASAYAEIIAEHAPEHPMVRELQTALAARGPRDAGDIDIDLDAPEPEPRDSAALISADDLELIDQGEIAGIVAAANVHAMTMPPPIVARTSTASVPAAAAPPAAPPPPKVVPPKFERTVPLAKISLTSKRATGKLPALPRVPEPPDARERARRIAIPLDVRIILDDGRIVDAHSRDISTSGLFVLTDQTLPVGATARLELLVPGKEAFTEDVHRATVRIVRRGDGGYGVELVAPDPELLAALAAL